MGNQNLVSRLTRFSPPRRTLTGALPARLLPFLALLALAAGLLLLSPADSTHAEDAASVGNAITTTDGVAGQAAGACAPAVIADGVTSGSWAPGCQSQHTVTDQHPNVGYARYYTFTLAQQSQVTIDLESSVDTYLYLRAGNARSGTFLHENDDVVTGTDLNSRISESLAAGTYTIEATTYAADAAGTFTLTLSRSAGAGACAPAVIADGVTSGSWAPGCQSQHTVTDQHPNVGYARYYTFTLGQQSQVTIDLESSVDTYLYLRAGNARSGTFLHENDDVVTGTDLNSRISESLAAGTYTIEATTYAADAAGTFTLTLSRSAGAGAGACAPVVIADGVTSGSWAPGCQSQHTVTDQHPNVGYARYYTFTLGQQSQVTIDLESSVDTYLYLRAGNARSGTFLHENDDVVTGTDLNSRISESLAAGTYTIEATTYAADAAGTFTLTVSGLSGAGTGAGAPAVIADAGAVPSTPSTPAAPAPGVARQARVPGAPHAASRTGNDHNPVFTVTSPKAGGTVHILLDRAHCGTNAAFVRGNDFREAAVTDSTRPYTVDIRLLGHVIPGVRYQRDYHFYVVHVDENSIVSPCSARITYTYDATPPAAPANFNVQRGPGSGHILGSTTSLTENFATLTWDNPNDPGIVKYQYRYECRPAGNGLPRQGLDGHPRQRPQHHLPHRKGPGAPPA